MIDAGEGIEPSRPTCLPEQALLQCESLRNLIAPLVEPRYLRKRIPRALELVYDNYNFFVIG